MVGMTSDSDSNIIGSYLAPGTPVRLDNGLEVEGPESEYGIVVVCWLEQMLFYDCYVAFFGHRWPEGMPAEKPYVLRYSSTSLKVVPSPFI